MNRQEKQMLRAAIVGLLATCALVCHAEPRWCSITGRGPNDTLIYPPIARAARVSGVVLGRVVFTTDGKFVRFEPVSGPKMLEISLTKQLEQWTFQTDATGDGLCQTLVIAEYRLNDLGSAIAPTSIRSEPGSSLHAEIHGEILCLCDPQGTVGSTPWVRKAWHLIQRGIHRAFGHHPKPWE